MNILTIRPLILVSGFLVINALGSVSNAQSRYSCGDYSSAISSLREKEKENFREGYLGLAKYYSNAADSIQRAYDSQCSYLPPTYSLPPNMPPVQTSFTSRWISDTKFFRMSRKSNGNIDYQSDHPKYKYAGWINTESINVYDNNRIEGTFEDAWSSSKKCKGNVSIEKVGPYRYISVWKMNPDSCGGVTIKTMLNLIEDK
jgi:hypothetical protein